VTRVLERIDHVTIGAPDLAAGIAAYRNIGFDVDDRGAAFGDDDGLQLVAGAEGLRSIALRGGDASFARAPAEWIEIVARRAMRAGRHPNRVQRIERVYIAVSDLAIAARRYADALALPEPRIERGTVINADMAIFQLGPTGLGLAQPAGPGVCADALETRGPGPFQVLFRTASMDAAAKWMAGHGVPPPRRGVRNTGEQAMLVAPGHACGVYIGFVGPA
jgi:catechol 2,3-dioxygenase-like lactoylglutathione lyase family enzyme